MPTVNSAFVFLVFLLVSLALAVGVMALFRFSRSTADALRELRQRMDTVLDAQREVPRQLAEDAALQARSLADVRERLVEMTAAAQRLETLGASVAEVHDLLRVPKLRGTLGEVWLEEALRDVLPAAGYEREYAFRNGTRVDAVVRLQQGLVPIDAKFPMEAYQRMQRSDGADRAREARTFRRSVRARIDEIAEKYIRPDEGTLPFALMYIPAESVFAEAILHDEGGDETIVSYAHARRVFPVSPNTLYAYLTALAHGLRGFAIAQESRQMLEAIGGIQQGVARVSDAFARMGRHLENALKQHHEAAGLLAETRRRLDGIADPPPSREEGL